MSLDLESTAKQVVDTTREQGVSLRMIGGMAFKVHCPSATHRDLARGYGDLDFVGYQKQRREIVRAFQNLGYTPDKTFNALQIVRQLFQHMELGLDIDVFLDEFSMCHKLSFINRLGLDPYTIPLADLLLTKLQVVQINEKDLKDIYALLNDHELGADAQPEMIDTRYIAKVCGDDWGWYKTVSINLEKSASLAKDYLKDEQLEPVVGKLKELQTVIESAPKSFRWKARARIGEKQRWYELPEVVQKPPLPGTEPVKT